MLPRALLALPLLFPITTAAAQESGSSKRICLAPASVEAAPSGADPVAAVRETFSSFLTGPSLSVTPLNARLASQVREEAKQSECAWVLFTTIKHSRKSGSGLLGRMAGGAVQQGAWSAASGAGSTVGRVAAGAAAGAAGHAASNYATTFQSRDELVLGYRLETGSGQVRLEKAEKKRAASDGQDLLTPLVEDAAEAVAETVAGTAR